MLRSLYSAISGLRNEQVAMDVTANNIANVSTTGFKAGRVSFKEGMSQMLKGASRPPGGNPGATNPMQVGLGMEVGSIDTMVTQGNLQSTGQITDLAIEGKDYFAYSNGSGTYYSRNGALQLDSSGRLVASTNGYALQGMMAASDGTYPAGTKMGDILVPYGEKSAAHATTQVAYQCNLDSDSMALGTVVHTNKFLSAPHGTDPVFTDLLTSLSDGKGNSLGITAGDVLTFSATDGNNTPAGTKTLDFNVTATSTIQDLDTALQSFIGANIGGGTLVGVTVDPANGGLQIDMSQAPGAKINNLTIRSNRPISNSYVSNLFNWGTQIAPTNANNKFDSAGNVRAPAQATDLLGKLFDANGNALGFETGDVINVSGNVGGTTIEADPNPLVFNAGTTKMSDLLGKIQSRFNLPDTDGSYLNKPSVSINGPADGDTIDPLGSIVVRGQPETAFALSDLSISATNNNNNNIAPSAFISNCEMTETQTARDTGVHSTSIKVYDESGAAHTMTTTFTQSGAPNAWLWNVTLDGKEKIVSGNTGKITFGQDGTVASFTFDDGSTGFKFDPENGSNTVSVDMKVGGPADLKGITQFRSDTTTAARSQDGYPMGKLSDISINEYGEVNGSYTNGVSKSLAKIYVADFTNPAGLEKVGDSMFQASNNSGSPVMLQAGVGTSSKIKPGALEMSNVELEQEFTNLITTERGYQANARVITTSDTLLQELVQLIR